MCGLYQFQVRLHPQGVSATIHSRYGGPLRQVVRQRIANPPSPVRIREGPILSAQFARACGKAILDGNRILPS